MTLVFADQISMAINHSRPTALLGLSLSAGANALATGAAHAELATTVILPGADKLSELMVGPDRTPRRRDFQGRSDDPSSSRLLG